ncbi:FliH/SctL family protein [Gorillibacterium timonense]|uniref:FliH/SctL family protein n=1 Tax=Gorillibacterium timonense TaxID=1689269 RepID=UPI000A53D60C|nr:FliH/SctL family protein [Gorillibacterium timonense]
MSLSNLIKPDGYIALEQAKLVHHLENWLLERRAESMKQSLADEESLQSEQELAELQARKDEIIRDAEKIAEEQIQQAQEEVSQLRADAEAEIAAWWEERRTHDVEAEEVAREQGYQMGYREGILKADEEVRQEYSQMTQEASDVLEQSYRLKNQIIQEAEPFLIDLSTAIAEKIIGRQLTLEPEWIREMAKSVLSRKRETGVITLCVAPQHFSYFHDAREELLLAVDSQAELVILPDATVSDNGCVVRTDFGSVDARIDTQLKEIKQALASLAAMGDESEAGDAE